MKWKALDVKYVAKFFASYEVNVLEEFVDEDDLLATETKVDDFDNAVYILNEKLQAVTPEVFKIKFIL